MKSNVQNTAHRQVRTVKYNDRDYRVQKDRNGFEYIKVSELGKRKVIALSTLEQDDEVFNYIFNYGFRDNPDPLLDALAKERIYRKIKPQPKTTKTVVVGLKTGEKKTFEIEKTQDIGEWLKTNKISYKYFKY